jgi:cyclopropane fatty-acyl-phospholipid synthase-like methyltransferase
MYTKHLPDEIAFDKGLIKAIVDFYKPKKSLDMGCGLGFYVRYLRDQGVDAWGVEGKNLSELFKSTGHQIQKDISQPFDLGEKYDLVLCLEVVEHISREFENIVFDNILSHMSKYLIFSGATVGQQGTGHVNERHESYWFSHLVRRGLVLRHNESLKIRLACTEPWYQKNISLWELVHSNLTNWEDVIAERESHIMSCKVLTNSIRTQFESLQLRLQQTEIELEQSRAQLQQTQTEFEQSQAQVEQTQIELTKAQDTICGMEASIFWKLKKIVLRIIRFFGFMRNSRPST